MLLQALHKYATERKLLERLPFQVRTVHLLIPLKADGSVRGSGFVVLTTPVTVGKKTRDEPGQKMILPRFPGEKNNTRAQYLCDPLRVVLGLAKDSAKPLPDVNGGRTLDAMQQHRMFWRWVEEARERFVQKGAPDARLEAIHEFRRNHLGSVQNWVSMWTDPNALPPVSEVVVTTESGNRYRLTDVDVLGFEVAGKLCSVVKGGNWSEVSERAAKDRLWADWRDEFRIRFDQEVGDHHLGVDRPSLCIVTGTTGERVADIHKPEVKIPGTPPKGAAFFSVMTTGQSFGQGAGDTASVSIDAAASYGLAFEELLSSDDTRMDIGGVTLCFWAERNAAYGSASARLLKNAYPAVVAKFLNGPFAGVERGLAKKDSFLSVAMSANGGRIMVREWLRIPLNQAIENFAGWFRDLEIAPLEVGAADDGEETGPYSLSRLGYALLPKSPGEDAKSPRAKVRSRLSLDLYSKAVNGTPVSLGVLRGLIEEFVTALVKDFEKKPTDSLSKSRFSLLKLILIRNHEPDKGEFMPRVHLATDTPDQAYNLGRFLALLARLQKKAHDGKLEGPGVVQRYYAGAASSPSTVFPVLVNLHNHHIRKLEQRGASGVRLADGFRERVGDMLKLIPKDAAGVTQFQAVFDLKEQGRFALGFYQQHAYDRASSHVGHLLKEVRAAEKANDPHLAESKLEEAKQVVALDDYPDLCRRVNDFKLKSSQE